MPEAIFTISHPSGLHLRPANMVYQLAQQFQSAVLLTNLDRQPSPEVDARGSLFDIISLGVSSGHRVRVRTEGADAEAALEAIRALVETNFGE
jgi:phosphotransferase system HPr (HPr) family protein